MATFCCGPSATGNGSGSDWNNQADGDTVTLTRGNLYYLADGAYAAKTLNTANSGTSTIEFRKATEADHGTNTGWNSTMGDGQATIVSLAINSGYWIINGNKGDGFSVLPPDDDPNSYGISITDDDHPIDIARSGDATNVTIQQCYFLGASGDVEKWTITLGGSFSAVAQNLTVRKCFMERWQNNLSVAGSGINTGLVWEYNICTDFLSTLTNHGESINASALSISGAIIRYNLFRGMEQGSLTACIVGNNADFEDGQIYGNVFDNLAVGNGVISGTSAGSLINTNIHHNTFIQNGDGPIVGAGSSSTGQIFQNNLVYDQTGGRAVTTASFNYYIDTTDTPSESNRQTGTGDPFVNLSGGDYRLNVNSDAGSESFTDALGNTGNTRGAFMFSSGAGTLTWTGTGTFTSLTVG